VVRLSSKGPNARERLRTARTYEEPYEGETILLCATRWASYPRRQNLYECELTNSPECDRSFTRSDALAKHMRTVHETEALRPSDPVPKGHNVPASAVGTPAGTPVSKLQRIRLKLSQPKDEADRYSESAIDDTLVPEDLDELELPEFGPEIGFDDHELQLRPYDLYRLLRRQIHWAEKEGLELKEEWEKIRPKRKQAWLEKETIFDDVIDAELRLFSAIVATEGLPAESGTGPNGVQKQQGQHVAVAEAEAHLSRDSMSIPS
jgi:hypothetical protein